MSVPNGWDKQIREACNLFIDRFGADQYQDCVVEVFRTISVKRFLKRNEEMVSIGDLEFKFKWINGSLSDIEREDDFLTLFESACEILGSGVTWQSVEDIEIQTAVEDLYNYLPQVGGKFLGFKDDQSLKKTTGAYYTPRELVETIFVSSVVPVFLEAASKRNIKTREIDTLKILDPACGVGNIIIPSIYMLAELMSSHEIVSDQQSCVRSAARCFYGVDLNPISIRVLKTLVGGITATRDHPGIFTEHRFRVGNALVGINNESLLEGGIPGEAYSPLSGDDKKVCAKLKKINSASSLHSTSLF